VTQAGITVLAGLIMLVGLFGVVAPVLPDVALIWLAALGYGLLVGWGRWGGYLFALITVLGAAAALAEVWGGGLGARVGGASIWAILAGLLFGLVGFVLFSPIGGVVGLLAGTFLVEWWRVRDSRLAVKGMLGIGVGFGLAFFVKLLLALAMVTAWLMWVFTA
jgi:uncharacterized protein YqgC (DUF456 family)